MIVIFVSFLIGFILGNTWVWYQLEQKGRENKTFIRRHFLQLRYLLHLEMEEAIISKYDLVPRPKGNGFRFPEGYSEVEKFLNKD